MKFDVVIFGELMVMFYVNEYGGFYEVFIFFKGLVGVESNVVCGLVRFGF